MFEMQGQKPTCLIDHILLTSEATRCFDAIGA